MAHSGKLPADETATTARLNAIRGSAVYAVALVLVCAAAFQTFSTQYFAPGMTSAREAGIAGIVIFSFCAVFYRLTRMRRVASALLLLSTYAVILVSSLRNGGVPAPTLAFLALMPLAATILFNRIAGVLALAGVALVLGVLYVAAHDGWASPSPHSAEHLRVLFVTSAFLTAAAIVIIALHYEKLVSDGLEELNLTAQRLSEEAAANQARVRDVEVAEERFALAAKGASVGIWDWVDVSRSKEIWTDQFYMMLGYQPGEIEASLESFQNLLHPDDHEHTFSAVETHLKKQAPFEVEYRLRHKMLGYRWYLGTGQAVWDENGAPRRMIGTIMDIDDRKRMEIIKNQFISTVSHELRTPMTSIIGSINLIRTEKFGEMPPKAQELLDIASRNGERLVRLVNDILDLEKINSGSMDLALDEIDLEELVKSAVEENTPFVSRHGAVISVCESGGPIRFAGDKDRILQVLANLISNAAKFSGENGKIEICARAAGDAVTIRVADNGRGIPAERLGEIFDRFVQLDGSSTRDQEGTGLGLAICKEIAEAHGGRIDVESEPGRGSVFTVILPREPAPESLAVAKAGR